MIKTDIIIIGAGPVGLFAIFEAGLMKLRCHLIDAIPQPGGQLAEIYPKKPIYDIPAYPEIIASNLIEKLLEQIKPFNPSYSLGEAAESLSKQNDGSFIVTTASSTDNSINSPVSPFTVISIVAITCRSTVYLGTYCYALLEYLQDV